MEPTGRAFTSNLPPRTAKPLLAAELFPVTALPCPLLVLLPGECVRMAPLILAVLMAVPPPLLLLPLLLLMLVVAPLLLPVVVIMVVVVVVLLLLVAAALLLML